MGSADTPSPADAGSASPADAGAPKVDNVKGSAGSPSSDRDLVLAQALRGALWTTRFPNESGVGAFSTSGGPWRAITSTQDNLRPSADGKAYAYVLNGTNSNGADASEVGIVDAETLDTRHSMQMNGRAWFARIAPNNPDMVVIYWASSSASGESVEARFLDLRAGVEVARVPITGNLDWTPDGGYVRVTNAGAIYLGTVKGSETALGKLALPVDTTAGSVRVDHSGKRLLVSVAKHSGQGYDRDLYVANLDGSMFERFTKTTLSSYGEWSPDDRYIAFNHDPDLTCGGFELSCLHDQCALLYAPVSARNITVNGSDTDPARPIALGSNGKAVYVQCVLLGWAAEP